MKARPKPLSSWSFRLLITTWWTGGGSNRLWGFDVLTIASNVLLGLGRRGSGAGISCSGLLSLLLGGVLNGEDRSIEIRVGEGSNVDDPFLNPKDVGLLAILGFSALLTGGGNGLYDEFRLISPDRRGGGGEGG